MMRFLKLSLAIIIILGHEHMFLYGIQLHQQLHRLIQQQTLCFILYIRNDITKNQLQLQVVVPHTGTCKQSQFVRTSCLLMCY